MRTLLTILALCATITPAYAVDATYGLYTGGARMIDVNANIDIAHDNYNISTSAKTIGIFARLLPWQGNFITKGAKNFQPTAHDYTVKWRKDSETLRFAYNAPGKLNSVTEIKGDTKTDKTPDDANIYKNTRDLLSAVAILLDHYAKTGNCNTDTLVFDGKRSLTVQTREAGTTTLNNPRLSIYTGPAHGCTVKIIPEKGNWPKKPRGWIRIQQMGEAEGRLPVMWLATPKGTTHPIPVRIDIHTAYGDVIAHLRDLK